MAEDPVSSAKDWFKRQAEKQSKNDSLSQGDFIGTVISMIIGVVILIFFLIHLTRPTGFFTAGFGTFDAILFFLIAVYEFIPQIIRVLTRKKSTAKPFEIGGSMLILIAMIYFLAAFPFDFTEFATPLPTSLEFLLSWVSNGIASAVMVLGIIGLCVAVPIQTLQWIFFKQVQPGSAIETPQPPQPAAEDSEKKAE